MPTTPHPRHSPQQQRGTSLIEALITVLILTIGLLGVAALQARALQGNQGANLQSQATALAYDIVDRMRANPALAKKTTGNYNLAIDATTPAATTTSPINTIDLNNWRTMLAANLPNGTGAVACNAATPTTCEITVRWFDRAINEDLNSNGVIDDTDRTRTYTLGATL